MDNSKTNDYFNDSEGFTYLGEPLETVETGVKLDTDDDASSSSDDKSGVTESVKKRLKTPVLTFQLIVCLLILTLLFLAKTFLFDLYSQFRSWYDTEYNATIFFSGDFSDFDFSGIFASTKDEL